MKTWVSQAMIAASVGQEWPAAPGTPVPVWRKPARTCAGQADPNDRREGGHPGIQTWRRGR
jgi:hypothetical protein